MLIKFKTPDPRAGTTARMDSSRGRQLIDAGSAVRLNEDGTEEDGGALRHDGPTVQEFVAAGYRAVHYPPQGYAPKSTPEEIAAAVAGAGEPTGEDQAKMTAAELRAALDAKGIAYEANASKADLLALMPAA